MGRLRVTTSNKWCLLCWAAKLVLSCRLVMVAMAMVTTTTSTSSMVAVQGRRQVIDTMCCFGARQQLRRPKSSPAPASIIRKGTSRRSITHAQSHTSSLLMSPSQSDDNNDQETQTQITTQTLDEGTHVWEQVIKKSRFIGIAHHCQSWKEAQDSIAAIRAEHAKARHVCFGMVAGHNPMTERSSDDGEPTGTAGAPILNSIRGAEFSDTLCAVVRYSGGIKLGAGGLIRAYGGTAREVLRAAPAKILIPQSTLRLSLKSSTHVGSIYEWAAKVGGVTQDETYLANGSIQVSIVCDASAETQLREGLSDATRGEIVYLDNE
jgi:uncharacterized YigZ family protein